MVTLQQHSSGKSLCSFLFPPHEMNSQAHTEGEPSHEAWGEDNISHIPKQDKSQKTARMIFFFLLETFRIGRACVCFPTTLLCSVFSC